MGSISQDVKNQLKVVDNALISIDNLFGNVDGVDYEDLVRNVSPVDRARYDVTVAFAINTLFWLYMRSFGEDPNDHKIKEELDRIKNQNVRLQQINDKAKRPKINQAVAERIVRHEINVHKKRKRKADDEEDWDAADDKHQPETKTKL